MLFRHRWVKAWMPFLSCLWHCEEKMWISATFQGGSHPNRLPVKWGWVRAGELESSGVDIQQQLEEPDRSCRTQQAEASLRVSSCWGGWGAAQGGSRCHNMTSGRRTRQEWTEEESNSTENSGGHAQSLQSLTRENKRSHACLRIVGCVPSWCCHSDLWQRAEKNLAEQSRRRSSSSWGPEKNQKIRVRKTK